MRRVVVGLLTLLALSLALTPSALAQGGGILDDLIDPMQPIVTGDTTNSQDMVTHFPQQRRGNESFYAMVTNATAIPIGPQDGTNASYAIFTIVNDTIAYVDPTKRIAGSVAGSSLNQSYDFGVEDRVVDVAWKPQGDKMYLSVDNGTVYEFDVSTPWNLDTATLNKTISPYSGPTYASDLHIAWRPDGTQFFVEGSGDTVDQYDASDSWNLSSLTLNRTEFLNGDYRGLAFKPDGSAFFSTKSVFQGNGSETYEAIVTKFAMPDPWNISTKVQDGDSYNYEGTLSIDVAFGPNGTNLYTLNTDSLFVTAGVETTGPSPPDVRHAILFDAWNLSSGSPAGSRPVEGRMNGLFIRDTLTEWYTSFGRIGTAQGLALGADVDDVFTYTMPPGFTRQPTFRPMTPIGPDRALWKATPERLFPTNYTIVTRAQTNETGLGIGNPNKEWVVSSDDFRQGEFITTHPATNITVKQTNQNVTNTQVNKTVNGTDLAGLLSFAPLTASESTYLIVAFLVLFVSAYHGWIAPAVVSLMAIPYPLFVANGVESYPINVTAYAILLAIAVVLQMAVQFFRPISEETRTS